MNSTHGVSPTHLTPHISYTHLHSTLTSLHTSPKLTFTPHSLHSTHLLYSPSLHTHLTPHISYTHLHSTLTSLHTSPKLTFTPHSLHSTHLLYSPSLHTHLTPHISYTHLHSTHHNLWLQYDKLNGDSVTTLNSIKSCGNYNAAFRFLFKKSTCSIEIN